MNELPLWIDAGRDLDEMGCVVGDMGHIGVKLPGTQWVLTCGPNFARALAAALETAADLADDVVTGLIAEAN